MNQYYNWQLVYPMSTFQNLTDDLNSTFIDHFIPDNALFVFVGQQSFTWNVNAKGPNINLYNNMLTANKKAEVEYENVLGTVAINSGNHYWEIKIEKFVE